MKYSRVYYIGNMFNKFTRIEIINPMRLYISARSPTYVEPLINLLLYYATLTTCIAGTSLHQIQLINE